MVSVMKNDALSLQQAREIGRLKLKIDDGLFEKALEAAGQMGVEPKDRPPMTLALAIMGVSDASKTDIGLQNELRDALDIVNQAEREWRLERSIGSKARLA